MTGYQSKRAAAQGINWPEHEPVALRATTQKAVVLLRTVTAGLESALAKTTTPPQRQPLTDEQIEDIAAKTMFPINFARAIEAAHGIKENT